MSAAAAPRSGVRTPRAGGATRVALVSMPFYIGDRPSIQVGLLAAIARKAGFHADTFHLNLELAAALTPAVYDRLCAHRGRMTGEWLFSIAAFGQEVDTEDSSYFEAFPEEVTWIEKHGKDAAFLSDLRHRVLPDYIDECLRAVDWSSYEVVGFTSTFQQNVASLALARRIKEAYPHVVIVFGGANMEDEMGPAYLRAFPFIDYAVIGEGDHVFPALLQSISRGEIPSSQPGLAIRQGDAVLCAGQAPAVQDMDSLPTPSYDEFFERATRLDVLGQDGAADYVWMLPFESSRGCWWGAKHHCTFCGLNGSGMAHRAKSPQRAVDELTELARKHGITVFGATDNILDMRYLREFFPMLTEHHANYQFFYEVKANLTPEQIGTLSRGGVRLMQPGIESLSTHVLELMRKGTTMLQNVRLLKWCRYHRIRVSWNLIWGFPGETREDYARELELLKLLTHLEPPYGCTRIWLERFSPYFSQREQFNVLDIRPEPSYAHAYPSTVDIEKVAYFFEYAMADTIPDECHIPTQEWVAEWRRRWESGTPDTLTYRKTSDSLFIDDNRGDERRGTHTFYGPMADIYEYCTETMRTPAQVTAHLHSGPHHYDFPEADVVAALDAYCTRGLMVEEEGRYLGLAIPVNPNW